MKNQRLIALSALGVVFLCTQAQIKSNPNPFKLKTNINTISTEFRNVYHKSDSIKIDYNYPIEGFAVSGKIVQPNQDSWVRIILEDKDKNEYVVLESNRVYNDVDTLNLLDYCEESKSLPIIYPSVLRIYIGNASLDLTRVSMEKSADSDKDITSIRRAELKLEFEEYRRAQVRSIINNINEYNQVHNKLWRAGITESALMPWENKKRVLGIESSSYPYGIEYYATGIFEFGEATDRNNDRTSSPYIDHFDWRNRHGKNWMTPIRYQSTGNGCWAFTAIGVTEALVNLYFNDKIDCNLSEQEIISCSGLCGSNANGGMAPCALSKIILNGVSEEDAFLFSNSDEPCSNKGDFNELVFLSNEFPISNYAINNNDSIKKYLINYGPLASGYTYNTSGSIFHTTGHAMVLVGYATIQEGDTIWYFNSYNQNPSYFDVIHTGDNRIGSTYWIFKNSWGVNHPYCHNGYAYVLFNDQSCFHSPYYAKTPVSSLLYNDSNILITDADGDGYYYWGIGTKPSHCPSWIPNEPDGDDSDISLGPMDEYGYLQQLSCGYTITTPTTHTGNQTLSCRLGIVNGGILTVSGTTTMIGNATIRVCEGGTLIVDGGTIQNANLVLVSGSTVILRNGGIINMASGKDFNAPIGAVVNVESGEIN